MVFVRRFVAASLALVALSLPASADDSGGFGAISAIMKSTVTDTGAPGDALLIGQKDAIFYTETAGKTNLDTPINLSAKTDLGEINLVLALIDAGFMGIDDPAKSYITLDKSDPLGKATIRQLMIDRARGGKDADAAAKALELIAQSSTGWSWDQLHEQWVGVPLGMQATQYSKTGDTLQTNGRDYARLLSMLAKRPVRDTKRSSTSLASDLIFRAQIIGAASCARQDETALCNLIEQDTVGLYAWVDRARGLYGVLTAPGAEVSIAKQGREIRAEAETIYDREHAGAGLTSSIGGN